MNTFTLQIITATGTSLWDCNTEGSSQVPITRGLFNTPVNHEVTWNSPRSKISPGHCYLEETGEKQERLLKQVWLS